MSTTATKERPILFNGEMVRAVLDGRKTQTRRIAKPPAPYVETDNGIDVLWALGDMKCPYGKPGERLWAQETFCRSRHNTFYRADGSNHHFKPVELSEEWDWDKGEGERWKPSIHMTRKYSRITLEITGVRVERLQDISEEDAIAEGVCVVVPDEETHSPDCCCGCMERTALREFSDLWESINGPGSWDANPWVWVVEFQRVEASA